MIKYSRNIFILIFSISILCFQISSIAQIPIAVVDLEAKGISNTEVSTLSDRLRDELFKTGKFQVMERGMMDQILEEQEIQLSGCTSNECLVEIGQLINVQQIVGGSIGIVGNIFSISARVISVETGEIITVSTYDYNGDIGGLLTQGMRNVAIQLASEKTLGSLPIISSGQGSIYISSEPSGAIVWVDGIKMDKTTPILVENQRVGEHKIYIQKEEYSAETLVKIQADDMERLNLVLGLGIGNLKVITTPFEANVYLDGKYKGRSPLLLKDIVAGLHSIKVMKIGYDPVEKSIEIKSNNVGEIEFTLAEVTPILLSDIDGNVYHTIKIGDQWWMIENLKVTHYRNGDPILNVTDENHWTNLKEGAYCIYYNDENNANIYGCLYNWYSINDNRKIAPIGWHVPTDEEWQTLVDFLGGRNVAGVKLKEAYTSHWNYPNTDATNESSFSALPGGCRSETGDYYNKGTHACFWSCTEYNRNNTWNRFLSNDRSGVYRLYYDKNYGFSVRCVKD